jgi:hypothetical protein
MQTATSRRSILGRALAVGAIVGAATGALGVGAIAVYLGVSGPTGSSPGLGVLELLGFGAIAGAAAGLLLGPILATALLPDADAGPTSQVRRRAALLAVPCAALVWAALLLVNGESLSLTQPGAWLVWIWLLPFALVAAALTWWAVPLLWPWDDRLRAR